MALDSALVVDGGQTIVLEGLRVCPSERGRGVAGVIQRLTDIYIKQVYPSVTTKRLTRSDNPGPEKLSKFTFLACRVNYINILYNIYIFYDCFLHTVFVYFSLRLFCHCVGRLGVLKYLSQP